jgi:hypothetical protein
VYPEEDESDAEPTPGEKAPEEEREVRDGDPESTDPFRFNT